jgi:hypothetical protein
MTLGADRTGQPAFRIDKQTTTVLDDPAGYRAGFAERPALLFDDVFAPDLHARIMALAAAAPFVDEEIAQVGTREVESPQRIGGMIGLLLNRPVLRDWIEEATGLSPVRAISGRLAQFRANGCDALGWHNDFGLQDVGNRLLGVVINLSDTPFEGGRFELRRLGETQPIVSHHYDRPGSMMLFAVRRDLEHRVEPVLGGGPRRIYAGWFLTAPEYPGHGLVPR